MVNELGPKVLKHLCMMRQNKWRELQVTHHQTHRHETSGSITDNTSPSPVNHQTSRETCSTSSELMTELTSLHGLLLPCCRNGSLSNCHILKQLVKIPNHWLWT